MPYWMAGHNFSFKLVLGIKTMLYRESIKIHTLWIIVTLLIPGFQRWALINIVSMDTLWIIVALLILGWGLI